VVILYAHHPDTVWLLCNVGLIIKTQV